MTSTLAPAAFSVTGALPTGTTVLEASAGTGKTFTIAALAARYVAEGHAALPELMLVTFGREATTELRERVRERLVSAHRGLADPVGARAGGDEVLALLAGVPDAEIAARRARLARALAGFDAATIATTHQFCQQMLDGLGVAVDSDPDARFVESIDDLIAEVVDDFYVRKYGSRAAGTPAFGRADAGKLARAAVYDGQARLEPADAQPGSPAHVRHRFADAVRREVAHRKRARRLYTYDDMLTRLSAALTDPDGVAARRLRARYGVVLVDEFQDTDPVQWHILRSAFHSEGPGRGRTTLVLIGDPKQAIYAFRGADVVSYLDATETAGRHATLARNWRSDAPLLRALDVLFAGAALGDERIRVHPVEPAHPRPRLAGAPVDTPLRIRVVPRDGLPQSGRRLALAPPARALVARDCAADIAELLASPATLDGVRVRPGDVAVLVRTNDQAAVVRQALADVGVPAVASGTASVFGTPVAREWLTLLEALEQPRAFRVRAAALTCFVGATAEQLCADDADVLLDRLGGTLREWAAVLHGRGVAALLEAVTGTELPRRLLGGSDGERRLTDLRHVAQAMHAAAVAGHLGPAALVDWLRHRIADAATDTGAERSRRLESDAAAVQVITVHRSKGLEFPVVHVPFGWDRFAGEPSFPLLHDAAGARVLDVGGPTGEGWSQRCAQHRAEEAGEDLRLLYVALTRARSQVVAWWVPATTVAASPLHRLLFGRPGPGLPWPGEVAASYRVPSDAAALDALRALAAPELAVEPVGPRAEPAFAAAPREPEGLRAARFSRVLDTAWKRTSYTALTATAGHGPRVSSEPEEAGTDDEADLHDVTDRDDGAGAGLDGAARTGPVSPMAQLPVGAAFGTLVHAIFEAADLTAADLGAELTAHAAEQLARRPVAGLDAATLGAALVPAASTPLGPLAAGLRLADIAPGDRLAELDFELPLGGGDGAHGPPLTLGILPPLLRAHLPADDPLRGYADHLDALADQPLRGYLTGSIDAVLRLPAGSAGTPPPAGRSGPGGRFLVVDYKTNWLGPVGAEGAGPLTAAHYAPDRMAEAMSAAHYPLQALLYCVALHRYLRWRLPGYAPERHLGGVLYLFVRGMCGPGTPVTGGMPHGVFAWEPPPALTVELSALLDGGGVS
ncbi:UvrD-helicase domain-containing protein [Pseudonocardia sp.]|uniref:UvrD-helicase domain-containing protein n=1 Tax=Pseudonocardia sp. TaxID=60912 RepID=UPI00260A7EBD|nr:UvrD-helicase domain-containing protein [Pseudonocardia sp.]